MGGRAGLRAARGRHLAGRQRLALPPLPAGSSPHNAPTLPVRSRSIADLLLFDIFDLHQRIYGEQMRAQWPDLLAIHDKCAGGWRQGSLSAAHARRPARWSPVPPLTRAPCLRAPACAAARVAAIPGVKAYLEGPLRLEKVNNNGLG